MMIYVAHPYGNLEANKDAVETIIASLAVAHPGNVYISPIHLFGYMSDVATYDHIMNCCLDVLARCDAALFPAYWQESRGCRIEMAFCVCNGIPWEVQKNA